MNRTLLTLATASILALGCGRAALEPAASPAAPPAAAKAEASKAEEAKAPAKPASEAPADAQNAANDAASAKPANVRQVGDYVVYRFTGAFRKSPMTLTQRVLERRGTTLTIALIAQEGDRKDEYRIKVDEAGGRNDVVSVSRIERGAEKPSTLEAYEALMARTALAADENEGQVSAEDVTVPVGAAKIACKRTSYRVRVGKNHATLKTLESTAFPWGDVGGEITASNGKVLFRAEIVEAGRDGAPKGAAMAHSDLDE